MKNNEWLDKGVLIYGPRKGGTTLLENLHDGNNALFVHSQELKLKSFLNATWMEQPSATKAYLNLNLITEQTATNLDYPAYKNLFAELESASTYCELLKTDIYNIYQSAKIKPQNPRMWIVKEVGGYTEHILALWRLTMPFNAPVIMILRDPLMVVRSIINDRRKKNIRLRAWEIFRETREAIRVFIKQLDYLDDPNTHYVTYDDLTASPENTMRGICDFLKIAYEDINSRPTIFGQSVVVSTSSKKSTQVFTSNKKWWQDLSLREQMCVKLSYCLFFKPEKLSQRPDVKKLVKFDDVQVLLKNRLQSS